MNFKHPNWRLMCISLGCLVLGFADWMMVTPDFKAEPDWRLWVFCLSYILMLFGAIACVVSLFWMIFASFTSGTRSHYPKP
jgi:hypothetical protein